ncbi:hypothetical protein [Anaerorhabdus sp.]|uniref:hypothetical protein n=1 Tax=Anaerorhabdus sp. TaxID=1872524 RepID=UPI002B1F1D6B|nr:hypothetical protein [Anaerorhabdus sp.]MEA4876014.1 hypothetical protein [Anaerorhabdus sp.]
MTEKEIDLILKSFKWHVKSYYYCIDKLNDIAEQLSGELSSPAIRSVEEAKYQRGTQIYKNRTPELLDEEEKLIKERNHHAYAIEMVYDLIYDLENQELNILDDYYWHCISINAMASMYSYSNRNMYYKIQAIIEKIAKLK